MPHPPAIVGQRPDERLDQSQRAGWIMSAINNLPDRQREALVLCALDGHTNITAAEIMGVSVEAMESLLARGRRKLKTLLQDQERETGT